MRRRIEDYAIIGNTYSAALVARDGSIDWLCLPRFDSPACFAALLGRPENGHWRIAPAANVPAVRRRYRGDTVILETEFETESGAATLVDFMPVPGEDERHVHVVRLVIGRRGTMPMNMEMVLRFDYGRIKPWIVRQEGEWGAIAGPDAVRLRTPLVLEPGEPVAARFAVSAGETVPFVLTWYPSHTPAPLPIDAVGARDLTEEWWRRWSSQCTFTGGQRDAVMRSLLTLKTLTYAPTGAVTAAATTSLPEAIGGVRNWDYRYCWLRDATFTLYALLMSGFREEALAWRDWLERAVAGSPEDMQIMYGIAGERRLWEMELPWLDGYEGSRPVRIGNQAHAQFQLDVYGEILDTLHVARQAGISPDREAWNLQAAMIDFVAAHWDRPDEGLWEVRGPRRHFTHSKVMAWVAVDRAIRAIERHGRPGPRERWRSLRAAIHADVCKNGFDARRGTFVQYYGGTALDAALLLIPLVGFLPATDARVQGTVAAIQRELVSDGLLRRYSTATRIDGLPGVEGAFLACSFWLVDNLLLMGRRDQAERLFERLLALRNDVGLLAEEYDPVSGRQLGNFPQAFSHVALVNSAQNLAKEAGPAEQRSRQMRPDDKARAPNNG